MRIESNFVRDPAMTVEKSADAPLIAHIIYRLDTGGLENGLINLINRIPLARYRHAVICLTGYSEFRRRIQRSDVEVYALDKPAGNSPLTLFRLWRLLKRLRPDIVHTRNLATLEAALPAAVAGVPVRIHGEHGRDVGDLDGSNRKFQLWRRLFNPLVHQYIALSRDLAGYLQKKIRVPSAKVAQLYNGVDTDLFHPAAGGREPLPCPDFTPPGAFVIGTIGRMQEVKDQLTLARAFVLLLQMNPQLRRDVRLVMVGDGPLRVEVAAILDHGGVRGFAWLAGERDDVPRIMRGLDLFVLPSLAEGVSNTILEAMASGLPVVATAVGGNPELVDEGRTGRLVPPADPAAMAAAIGEYVANREMGRQHGSAARMVAKNRFSMTAMVNSYLSIYDRMLERRPGARSRR
jgi:sugar transferase (PEP-CTERM/EpsH1 system associated)